MRRDVDWREGLEAALKEAAREDRLILVHFGNSDLPLSAEMDGTTFTDGAVVDKVRAGYVAVRFRLPADRERYRRMTGGRGSLGTCVLDPAGETIAVLQGYADGKAMLRFLENTLAHWPALQKARAAKDAMAQADAYEALDHRGKAEELYRKAAPGPDGMAHAKLARLLILRGRNLEAREELKLAGRAGAMKTHHEHLFVTEGLCLLVELKPGEAITRLTTDLRTYPTPDREEDALAYVLGMAYHDAEDPKRALGEFEKLIRLWPESRWRPAAERRIDHIRNPPPGHEHPK